jgi:hypothetical protein
MAYAPVREHISDELPYPTRKDSTWNKSKVISNITGKILQEKDKEIDSNEVKNGVIERVSERLS